MQTHHYLIVFLVLAVLAMLGFTLAMRKDMHPSTTAANKRWCWWMLIMGVLALADIVGIMQTLPPQ